MKKDKICSFFGHRNVDITVELREKTEKHILDLINLGYNVFYFGGFSDFDDLCYQIVSKYKNERKDINLIRTFCVWQEKYLRKKSPHFNRNNYDNIIYLTPSFYSWYKSIYFRNCAIVDSSDYIVFFVKNESDSGAYKTLKYALSKKKDLINLYDSNPRF